MRAIKRCNPLPRTLYRLPAASKICLNNIPARMVEICIVGTGFSNLPEGYEMTVFSTAYDRRYDVRPRQRGREGFPPLDLRCPPTFDDVMIDRLEVRVSGTFGLYGSGLETSRRMHAYRDMMLARAGRDRTHWLSPQQRSIAGFRVPLHPDRPSTISAATIYVKWEPDRVALSLQMRLNPTRTLAHRLPFITSTAHPISALAAMQPEEFFAISENPALASSLDGNDNALDNIEVIRRLEGSDFWTPFLFVYEQQLRQWVTEALAPSSSGFIAIHDENGILAHRGEDAVHIAWPKLKVRSAEAYIERRHTSAVTLLDRLANTISNSHAKAQWRLYGENDIGGTRAGSKVVGVDLTGSVQQIYYAKTLDRVRVETRFTKEVGKSTRRLHAGTEVHPLSEILSLVRQDVVDRSRWDVFCAMCVEPQRPMLVDAVHLMSAIVDAARASHVPPEPVLTALLGAGSIEETPADGAAPARLLRRLEAAGVITRASLQRRRRPGEIRRHGLTAHWIATAERIRAAFDTEPSLSI